MVTVRETMNPVLLSIAPERAVSDAARAMADRRVHHLLVMQRGDLAGIICTCDVSGAAPRALVGSVMSRRVVTAAADQSVDEAVHTMLRERIGFLPIVDGAAVIGVVTRGDLARALGSERERRLMLACRWCGSHRHVNFIPIVGAPICDDCRADEEDLGVGEGD